VAGSGLKTVFQNGALVGINMDPVHSLDVTGTARFANSVGVGGGTPQAGYALVAGAGILSCQRFECATSVPGGFSGSFGGSVYITNGLLAIETLTPGYNITCNGSAAKPGGGTWIDTNSLRKFKRNIRPLTDALATLLRLDGRQWEWDSAYPDLETLLPGTQTGFVIEEVEAVHPAWITYGKDGEPGLAIRGFEALTVEGFKELVARLQALEARLDALAA
jgi:hypothetical protein